jgi:hypothetical protein
MAIATTITPRPPRDPTMVIKVAQVAVQTTTELEQDPIAITRLVNLDKVAALVMETREVTIAATAK